MTYKLFIDDERFPPNDGEKWEIARHMFDVQMFLIKLGMPKFISFDHDLGENQFTGYEIAKQLVKYDMDNEYTFDLLEFDFYVHSQNPIGKKNIEQYLGKYLEMIRESFK